MKNQSRGSEEESPKNTVVIEKLDARVASSVKMDSGALL